MNKVLIFICSVMAIFGIFVILGFSFVIAGTQDNKNKIDSLVLEKFEMGEERVLVDVYLEGVLSGDYLERAEFDDLLSLVGGESVIRDNYPLGFQAELSEQEVIELSEREEIEFIDFSHNYRVFLNDVVDIIDAEETWNVEIGGVPLTGEGSSVCVLDTGIEFSHPDLADKNIVGANVNCYDEGLCFVDPNITDLNGHGTHVAGIVGASGGINGVAKGANLIGMKIFPGSDSSGTIGNNVNSAIFWCDEHSEEYNISVVSMSFGTATLFEDYCSLGAIDVQIALAVLFKNMTFVAATGNDGNSGAISGPACIQDVIPVAATTKSDELWDNSNFNGLVKLFAPGEAINSTSAYNVYGIRTGTSMSAPAVSGAVAVVKQFMELTGQPGVHPKTGIENLLFENAEQIIDLPFSSWRRINLFNAVSSFDMESPGVELVSPQDGELYDGLTAPPVFGERSSLSSVGVSFRCDATDDIALSGVSLNIWDNAHHNLLLYTDTISIGEQSSSVLFDVPLSVFGAPEEGSEVNPPELRGYEGDDYYWNCNALDVFGNTGTAGEDYVFFSPFLSPEE